jgi:hypothetical protein
MATARRARLNPSGGGRYADGAIDRVNQISLVKWLSQHYGPGPAGLKSFAADEHVRDGPATEYFLHGGDAAAVAQSHIDDHQLRFAASGGRYGIGLGCLDGADVMPHVLEQFAD